MERGISNAGVIGLMIANAADRRLYSARLMDMGYGVKLLTGPQLVRDNSFLSLILVDEASGRRWRDELVALRQRARPFYLPLLLALSDDTRLPPRLRASFDDVLRLPLKKEDLLGRLEALLRLRKHSEELFNENARLFQVAFDIAPVAIVHIALDGRLMLANQCFGRMTGYAEDEVAALTADRLIAPGEMAEGEAIVDILLAASERAMHTLDRRFCRKDGSVFRATVAVSLLRDADGNPVRLIAALDDITERKQMEEALREAERFTRSTLDALAKHVCVTDRDGRILAVNRAWREFAGANGASSDTDWINVDYLAVCDQAVGLGAEDARVFGAGIRAVAAGERSEFRMEYSCHSPAQQRWFVGRVARLPSDGPMRLVIAHQNITHAKEAEKNLVYLAHHDSLTGLPNRVLLEDRLRQAIAHASLYEHHIWVVSLDIDRFEFINDTLGLKAGNRFLIKISERLQSLLRASDALARFGGDEFVLILPRGPGEPPTSGFLQRIMATLSQPLTIDGHEFFPTCSMGIAGYPNDGTEPDTLIEHAQNAQHWAKERGRNNCQFYRSTMNVAALERMRLESDLRNALERKEFVLHYQPQVDLRTGSIVGMEALIRWQHPRDGLVSPGRFIALAEEIGLIVPIGMWVIQTACAQNKAWQDAGLGALRIAVNLSARQLAQEGLVQAIAAILEQTGLDARYLDIELTESTVMADVEQSIGILHEMKSVGVQLSIDDFGTGYSSLSYLKRFPVDFLKIDQSFVRDIPHECGDAAIASGIISMAHKLGIGVIAEGVESEAQCEFLAQNMCDEIQGYWFSGPLDAVRMEALLHENPRLPSHLQGLQKPAYTLLLVAGEENERAMLERVLQADGYRILSAASGAQALEILAWQKVDVILCAQSMPAMGGVEFMRKAAASWPDTVRIVLSRGAELQAVIDAVDQRVIDKFLCEPLDDARLREHVADAFRRKEMADENKSLRLAVYTAGQELSAVRRRLDEVIQKTHEGPEPGCAR
jgi:diguanylate cyclase (GGDEF)-like protein/PAS domain S-box-containing protein